MDDIKFIKIIIYTSLFRSISPKCHLSYLTDTDNYYNVIWNCSRNRLHEIHELPHLQNNATVALDLSYNNFHNINVSSFNRLHERHQVTALILHHNNISNIQEGSFGMFANLKSLNLGSCLLKKSKIHDNAFSNLTGLKELIIDNNVFQTGYPTFQISTLQALETLYIDVFEGFIFDDPFSSLKHLQNVSFTPQGVFHLRNSSFHGLSKCPIEYLYLHFDSHVYCDISEDLFCSFPFVKGLQIEIGGLCNFTRALRSMKCLQDRTVDFIDVSGIMPSITSDDPPEFNKWAVEYLKNICVKTINLSNNGIMYLSFPFRGTHFMKCLEYLDVSGNQARVTIRGFTTLLGFPKLKVLNMSHITSYQPPTLAKAYPFSSKFPSFIFYIPYNIEILDFSYNAIHPLSINVLNATLKAAGLKELYLIKTVGFCDTFTIFDMPLLEYLDTSGSIFNKELSILFVRLWKLKTLRARQSMQNIKLSDAANAKLFSSLKHLSFLDLSENFLNSLPFSIFTSQRYSLKTLILDSNNFETIPAALEQLHSLSSLSLRDNKIKTISQSDIDILGKMNNILIDIGGNLISCSCYAEESLATIKENLHIFTGLDHLRCSELNSTLSQVLNQDWRKYQLICISPFWLKFSITAVLIVIIIIIMVTGIYSNRVIVDYFLLRLRLFMRRRKYDIIEEQFNFDVFISYSGYDHDWVTSTLYKKLAQFGFRVCLHHKDFIPGNCISEEIVKYIDESRKVLFMVTENFLKSSWTSYEVQMAKQHAFRKNRESMIIILMKDDIPIARMPQELRNFWWKIVCAKWPKDECNKEVNVFWENLKTAIEQ